MNIIYDAEKALCNLQDNTIGLFVINGTKTIDLVVSLEGETLIKTVTVGNLGGITTTHININRGRLFLFEDNQTLGSLKSNPFRLREITELLLK